MNKKPKLQRTKFAEEFFDRFASVPLTAEFVFYSPQYLKNNIQKEVCDFLLILKGEAILISMKAQEDPLARTGDKLKQWLIKSTEKGLDQAQGALKTIKQKQFWCDHLRRGRVDFKPDSISIRHVIVITEVLGEVVELSASFPMAIEAIPVTYLSVNDFFNLVNELRAFYDISAYLEARRSLSAQSLHTIGDEIPFYKYYILNKQSFEGCCGHEDARNVVAARDADWEVELTFRPLKNEFANVIEYVSDALATRQKNYADGLNSKTIALFDSPQNRKNYLLIQEELCDLRFDERQALGMQFKRLMDKVRASKKSENMAYGVGYLDSKPDFVYVFVSAKKVSRPVLIDRTTILLRAAMTAYEKTRGMIIADRDGENFEITMAAKFSPKETDFKLAEYFFAPLRIEDIRLS